VNYVLVVDDSLVDRRLAGHLLEDHSDFHVEYASNGLEALELLEARLPLAIVTDLQMPEMDGMQLVEVVRRRFPTVPMIVMTGHGSEDVALQALMLGAADYVSKGHLTTELRSAVEQVLAISVGERAHQRLSHCLRYQELQFELDSDLRLIAPLVDELQQVAVDLALVDHTDRVRLSKVLAEVLHNAIYHGSREGTADGSSPMRDASGPAEAGSGESAPPRGPRVYVRAVFSPQEARFTIRDEGPGFDVSQLPDVKADPSHLSSGGGRGLVLAHMFMDEVSFNPAGNEITLVRRAGPRGD
jgi:CheY-like chemotaxis protein/anti-sigma regulatory factor (Ser/Thr protein kinase)